MLSVLCAKVDDVGRDDVEQNRDDRRHPIEVANAALLPFECFGQRPTHLDAAGKVCGVDLFDAGGETDRRSGAGGSIHVALLVARVLLKVFGLIELRRVNEDRDDDNVVLTSGALY